MADRAVGLGTVKLSKNKLLNKLKENRQKHIEDYEAAIEGYYQEAQRLLKEKQKELNKLSPREAVTGDFRLSVHLSVPTSYTEKYDSAITKLEFETDQELVITNAEFEQYVMDNWDFTDNFKMTNMMYADAARKAR